MDSSSQPERVTPIFLRPPPYHKGIRFLRATSKDEKSHRREKKVQDSLSEKQSQHKEGQEARDFYESVITSDSSTATSSSSSVRSNVTHKDRHFDEEPKKKTTSTVASPTSTSRHRVSERIQGRALCLFLRSAQEGDVKSVRLMLEKGDVGINAVDSYAWTALMCATYSGQSDVVELLMREGALWEGCRDKSGYNALDLAKKAGHLDIARMLCGHDNSSQTRKQRERRKSDHQKKVLCNVCKVEFSEDKKNEHQSSTVHLFNCRHQPRGTLYYIPESNIGYQMMMKDGWDKEKGLGPDGTGLKFPVKTILKRDRKGLGATDKEDETAKARVTHFKPFDVKAVKRPSQPKDKKMRTSTLDKRARKKSEMKERNWEKDFRQSFDLDLL